MINLIELLLARAVKATGIVDICFPADNPSELIDSSDVTFNPIITLPSTTPLHGSTSEFRSTITSITSKEAEVDKAKDESGKQGLVFHGFCNKLYLKTIILYC